MQCDIAFNNGGYLNCGGVTLSTYSPYLVRNAIPWQNPPFQMQGTSATSSLTLQMSSLSTSENLYMYHLCVEAPFSQISL